MSCGCHQQNRATEKYFSEESSSYFNMPLIRIISLHYSSFCQLLLSISSRHDREVKSERAEVTRDKGRKREDSFHSRKGKRRERKCKLSPIMQARKSFFPSCLNAAFKLTFYDYFFAFPSSSSRMKSAIRKEVIWYFSSSFFNSFLTYNIVFVKLLVKGNKKDNNLLCHSRCHHPSLLRCHHLFSKKNH